MSYHGFGRHARLELRDSPALGLVLCLLYGIPLVLVLLSAISPVWKLLTLFLVLLGLRSALKLWALPAMGAEASAVSWSDTRGWHLVGNQGDPRPVLLVRAVWLLPSALLLRFRNPQGRTCWVATVTRPDSDAARRLRVHLRWGGLVRSR